MDIFASASDLLGATFIALIITVPLLGLFIWWIITLVHAISHPDVPDRILWIVLHFVGLSTLAAPIYYFAVMKPYDKAKRAQAKPAKE